LSTAIFLGLDIFLDRGCSRDPFKTKKTTMLKYKKVYSGYDQLIHFRFSTSLNITFVALMYGLAMPIMWPLASLAIFNQRFAERVQVAWLTKLPPMMDDSITNHYFGILRFAPLILLMNSYWLMDSRQIFDNVWAYRMTSTDTMRSGHYVDIRIAQSAPIIIVLLMAIFIIVIQAVIPEEIL